MSVSQTNNYTGLPGDGFIATTEHSVTFRVARDLMALAWPRGWNECNAAYDDGEAANLCQARTHAPDSGGDA